MSDASPATDPAPPVDESTIYVTTQGTQVGKSHDRLVVRAVSEHALQTESAAEHGDEGGPEKEKTEVDLPVTLTSFPIKHVETVNLFGSGVDPTAGLFSVANQENITVNFFTTHGQFRGRFVPERSSVAVLHKQQHTLTDDTQLAISKQLVRGKITNALRYLRRKDTATGQATLKEALKKAASAATKQELRGAEGEAADAFFTGYGETLRDDWVFRERSRRPPEDHINALLSLMYTLTQQRCESALRAVNLDPYVGCFHVMRHGRPALALDLVEEFRRALADRSSRGL